MQVLCISGYLGCSHSDSCCWNPVKLWLWHSALVVPAYSGNAIMIPPTAGGICPSAGLYSHPPSLSLSFPMQPLQSQCQVWGDSTPEFGRAVLHHCRCHQHAHPTCDHTRGRKLDQLDRLLAKQHCQGVGIIDRPPWPLAVLFSEWTLERKGSMEPPSVVEEALQQDGP